MRAVTSLLDSWVRRGLRPGSAEAYGFAIACVLAATLLRLILDQLAPNAVPFATFFPALLIAALAGGLAAGTLATVLGGLVSWWAFLEPRFGWATASRDHVVSIGLYLVAAALIVWTAHQYRLVLRRVDEEENYRRIVIDELGQRVKIKLATIHAILRHELRDHPQIWDSVSGRLQALSAADDFAGSSGNAGVDLRQILAMQLAPYDGRFTLHGEPVPMAGKLPTALALLIHELASNAARYGALSTAYGRVDVSWQRASAQRDAGMIELTWSETGGPAVQPPSQHGFGTTLIERSMENFGGSARLDFADGGLVCRIKVPAPPLRATQP